MRSYYLDYAAQLVQKGPPKAAPQEEAPAPQPKQNRPQRRAAQVRIQRLNNEIRTLAKSGKPISMRLGPDGGVHAVVDKKALKKREAEQRREAAGAPEVVTEVSGGELPELPSGAMPDEEPEDLG
jgi:hypothetical protein